MEESEDEVPVLDVDRIWDETAKKSRFYSFSSTGRTSTSNSNCEPGYLKDKNYDDEKLFAQYGMAGMTREKLYEEIKITLEETVKSIEKYGGYYIERYETRNVTKTGSSEQNKANNVYDIAGNVLEWTLSTGGSNNRRYRGGDYGDGARNCSAPYSLNNVPIASYIGVGVRSYFYIK